jgi:hypothetical protein
MTYRRLMESMTTAAAREAALDLCVLHGYETEVSQDDDEYIESIELMETGGC